ncbi:MAG: hypothetical protein H8D23_36805 [Candidatus Brocadiales bacterium]|nr:hypothetical protein [Candidatus Brocadiales bacterium]
MITEQYNYAPISRESVDGRRLYNTPDGNKLPSVTTILDQTKPEKDKQALENWRKRVGHQQAASITKEASSRGTRMHTYLENYIKDDQLEKPGSNPYSIQSNKMADIVINEGLSHVQEYYGVEVPLYFPEIYAGTTDCVGLYDNEPAIIDFKQTNKPKKLEWILDYEIQLVAYSLAHNAMFGTDIKKGVILMCSKDYEFQRFIVQGSRFSEVESIWWSRVHEYYSDVLS